MAQVVKVKAGDFALSTPFSIAVTVISYVVPGAKPETLDAVEAPISSDCSPVTYPFTIQYTL